MQANNLSRRQFLQLAGAGAAGAVLLAASAAPPAAAPAATTGSSGGAAASAEPVTLTFGHHWEAAFRPHQDEFDKKYIAEHPNTKIEITYNTWADHNQIVPTWAAAGTLPDVIYVHGRYARPWNHEDNGQHAGLHRCGSGV